ncbi:MAG TPA: SDR family oxidoreductase [Victivallales bacterium]|nr:SDR family oxidoreductase [Victivallales bacterium]
MLERLFNLEGKVALVTGASSGIGKMIAQGYLEFGAKKVYITARGEKRLGEAVKELSEYGNVEAVQADVTSEEDIQKLINTLCEKEDELNILVNNAGYSFMAPFDDYPSDEFINAASIMLKTPFTLVRGLRDLLEKGSHERDPSRIINTTSIDAHIVTAYPNYAYSVGKASLEHLTRYLANILTPKVTVNSIAPGPILTNVWNGIETIRDEFIDKNPMKRLGGIEDMAGAAIYLSSKAGSYVTGTSLIVDGGVVGTLSPESFDSVKAMF